MKKNWALIISLLNTILLVACLVQINNLKIEIQNTRNNLSTQISNILTNVNNSYSYIEDVLEEEASIISDAEWEFGKADVKAGTVELNVQVTPKEHQLGVTQAVFVCAGKEVTAEYDNGTYIATLNLSLYEDCEISSVLFKENEMVRTEKLDWLISPRNDLLPYVYAYMYGTTSFGKSDEKENVGVWTFSGDVEVDIQYAKLGELEVDTVEIVRVLDGKEVERFDITMDAMTSYDTFMYNWNKSYEIPFESVQELYVDVTMGDDIVYRAQINYCKMDEQGEPIAEDDYWENLEAVIYDTEGKLLYSINESLYK